MCIKCVFGHTKRVVLACCERVITFVSEIRWRVTYGVYGSQYAQKIKKCMEFNSSHLFIAWRVVVDCVADKSKLELKKRLQFLVLNGKRVQLCCKSHFKISNFQTFVGEPAPKSPPPRRRGIAVPYLYSQLLHSNLLQFLSYFEPFLRWF